MILTRYSSFIYSRSVLNFMSNRTLSPMSIYIFLKRFISYSHLLTMVRIRNRILLVTTDIYIIYIRVYILYMINKYFKFRIKVGSGESFLILIPALFTHLNLPSFLFCFKYVPVLCTETYGLCT